MKAHHRCDSHRVPPAEAGLPALEDAYRNAPWDDWIQNDPVQFVRWFESPRDQEIVGFIAASLAYGRVESINNSVRRVLDALGWQPYRFITENDDCFHPEHFTDCVHRFHTPKSQFAALAAVKRAIETHGSLGALFLKGYSSNHDDTRPALTRFVHEMRRYVSDGAINCDEKDLYGCRHFLASPGDGSACKRLNLFLRWMVRRGIPDVGAWTDISPAKLLIPVDVHVGRFATRMGWTSRTTPDVRMSLEITETLRHADPEDPVRYDFVISHTGMDGF